MAGPLQHLWWRIEQGAYAAVRGVLGALPLDRASAAGGAIARAIGPLTGTHRVADRNMQIAFPERDALQRTALLSAMWDNIGRTFAEAPHLHTIQCYEPGSRIEVQGVEILDAIRESGRPVVFVAGHFANWEVMAMAIVQRGVDCAITYRAANNPYFDEAVKAMRRAYGVEALAPKAGARGAKALLDHLESGRSVALMNDQKFNEGIAIPFFGHDAMTAPGPTRLAMRTGAKLVPIAARRLHGGRGGDARFLVHVHEPIEIQDTGDRAADIEATVTRINRFMEDRIREAPADWFWVHRRFPKGLYRRDS